MDCGNFVISLDFELMWGVRDKKTIEQYGKSILGVHTVIPRLLSTFNDYKICGTFSTVGFLFFETKAELLANIPAKLPDYSNKDFSPYLGYFDTIGKDYYEDLYHFAPQLIDEIKKYPEHEIGSHTFSHYYCLENGQTLEDFKADMEMAIKVAKNKNVNITSLIFPRNQFNNEYLNFCGKSGIICYRGNEHSWLYKAKNGELDSKFRRAFRLIDAYINISGHNCYSRENLTGKFPVDIPSSRFLRPYNKRLKIFEKFRLNRIKNGMTYAAKNNLTYHLWWHPHNFGTSQNENFDFLEKICKHYNELNKKYNFQSLTMSKLANQILNER